MKIVSERRTWTKVFPGDDDVPLGRQKSIKEVGGELYRITETIQREGVFAVVPSACSVCDKKSDAMNDSIAAYLSEHGSTGRLNFAGTAQRAENDTDVFPVDGWDTYEGSICCPECLQEITEAINQAKRKIQGREP